MKKSKYVYTIFYLERKYFQTINQDLKDYGFEHVRAIIPTVKVLRKAIKGKLNFEEVPILFNYGFIKMPLEKAYSRPFLNKLKKKIPGIRSFLKDTQTIFPKKKRARIDNAEDFDDFLIGLIFERSIAISIAHGTANSLNLWFYLGSYNLIPDLMSVEFEMDLHETLITEIVGIFYSHTNKSSEEMDDYYIVNEGFTKLAYSIYDISLNKAFQIDYTKSFLEEINKFIQYMYKNANDTIQRYFYTMNKLHQHGGLISTEYFNFYQSLFIKYGYDISDDIFPGVLMLTRILEDVVDYYITCIPMIYRYRSDNIQTVISDYLKIFHCLFGVGMHELYNIPNS